MPIVLRWQQPASPGVGMVYAGNDGHNSDRAAPLVTVMIPVNNVWRITALLV